MTPKEFKAWFDGFTEAFTGTPTKAQWARIKERVGEIDGTPTTERIYVDRYVDRYWRYTPYHGEYHRYLASNTVQAVNSYTTSNLSAASGSQAFNAGTAMFALGKADAQALC